jgi:hypothetical protein
MTRSLPGGGATAGTLSGSDQENLLEVTGRSAASLEILARALHVKNAELQPTLVAITSMAVTLLSPARYAGLTVVSRGELIPRASMRPMNLRHLTTCTSGAPRRNW